MAANQGFVNPWGMPETPTQSTSSPNISRSPRVDVKNLKSSFSEHSGGKFRKLENDHFRRSSITCGRMHYTEMKPFRKPDPANMFEVCYDSNRALWLITSACLVYKDASKCRAVALDLWGFSSFKFFEVPETDTEAMAFCTDSLIIVSFRGTSSKNDWDTNLDSAQVNFSSDPSLEGVKVHMGFNVAVLSIIPQLRKWLLKEGGKAKNPGKLLYMTGHSLGGALATLAYAHFTLDTYPFTPISVNGVYTVGQPRVGNPAFVTAMEKNGPCALQRIFNSNDVVPTLPPSLEDFKHYGSSVYFNKDGSLHWRPESHHHRTDKIKLYARGNGGLSAHKFFEYHRLVENHYNMIDKKTSLSSVYRLVVTVHSASNIKVADMNGTSDPFVVCKYGHLKMESPYVLKTINPVWDHEFVIPEIPEQDSFIIEVRDQDSVTSETLGSVVLQVKNGRNISKGQFDLAPLSGKKKHGITGSVCISCEYQLLRSSSSLPCAQVEGVVLCGRSLKITDTKTGDSDPYLSIHCGSFQKKSPPIRGTLNPDWGYKFKIPCVMLEEVMFIDVFDAKTIFLGRATITLSPFDDIDAVEFPLESRTGKKDKEISGSIFCGFRFNLQPNDGYKCARGIITIVGARDVKAADPNGFSDPFVKMMIGVDGRISQTETTKYIKKTLNPTWNQTFKTKQSYVTGTPFLFEVWDHDTLSKNDFLGLVELKFSSYRPVHEEWFALGGNGSGISGELCLSFEWMEDKKAQKPKKKGEGDFHDAMLASVFGVADSGHDGREKR